ncbi:MAG: PIG-L deacetylase family protein [Bryobacteraceae bacterium]
MAVLLAVFAHPDDEFSVAMLLAAYAKRGHDVYLASITSGQLGSTPNMSVPKGPELARVREEELRCAAKCLGIHEPIAMGFMDQGISSRDAAVEVAAALRELFARINPDAIITFGPDGISGHPDHRAASNLVTEVCAAEARKLYYVTVPASCASPPPPPFRRLRTTADALITTVVDCRGGLDEAAAAARCHRSQWSAERAAQFDSLNRDVLKGRIYLRLAFPSAHHPMEEDLFQD